MHIPSDLLWPYYRHWDSNYSKSMSFQRFLFICPFLSSTQMKKLAANDLATFTKIMFVLALFFYIDVFFCRLAGLMGAVVFLALVGQSRVAPTAFPAACKFGICVTHGTVDRTRRFCALVVFSSMPMDFCSQLKRWSPTLVDEDSAFVRSMCRTVWF